MAEQRTERLLRMAGMRRGLMFICNAKLLPGQPTLAFPAMKTAIFVGAPKKKKELRGLGWKVAAISAHRVEMDADKELAKAFKRAK